MATFMLWVGGILLYILIGFVLSGLFRFLVGEEGPLVFWFGAVWPLAMPLFLLCLFFVMVVEFGNAMQKSIIEGFRTEDGIDLAALREGAKAGWKAFTKEFFS